MNEINWLSMALATATPFFIGAIYYHPAVFGKVGRVSTSNPDDFPQKGNRVVLIISSIIFAFFLSFFLLNFNNDGIAQEGDFDNFLHGAWHGFFVAMTLAIPVVVLNGWRSHMSGKSILVHIGFWIITLVLMGGIVDAMNHWENVVLGG